MICVCWETSVRYEPHLLSPSSFALFVSDRVPLRWMEDIRLLGCLMCQHPSPTLAYIIHIKDAHCRKCASHVGSDKRGPLNNNNKISDFQSRPSVLKVEWCGPAVSFWLLGTSLCQYLRRVAVNPYFKSFSCSRLLNAAFFWVVFKGSSVSSLRLFYSFC